MRDPSGCAISVDERIRFIAKTHPGRVAAFEFADSGAATAITWSELERKSAAGAELLPDAGTAAAPAVIAFEASSTIETLTKVLACMRQGLPLLPLNPKAPPAEQNRLLRVASADYPVHLWNGATRPGPPAGAAQRTGAAHPRPGYLLATGGSSGQPKLIAHPGPVDYDSGRVPNRLLAATGWQNGQRQLIVGALHHAAPFTTCLEALLDANTIFLQESFRPRDALRIMSEYDVEWTQLTPTHMQWMLLAMASGYPRLSALRAIVHTAAPCPASVKRAWIEMLGPTRVFEFYAATEGIGTTLVRGDEWLRHPGTVGRGFFTQIRVLDERFRLAPAGSVGEIYMRKSGFLAERATPPGGSVKWTPDGFSSVSDYGWLDEENYLFLSPRREHMVVVGGENVYPAEVESVLMEHAEIYDSAVIGIPDDLVGKRLAAFVVLRPGARPDTSSLLAFCSDQLSAYKVPRSIYFVDQLPRSDSGKLERWRLPGAVDAAQARDEMRLKDGGY